MLILVVVEEEETRQRDVIEVPSEAIVLVETKSRADAIREDRVIAMMMNQGDEAAANHEAVEMLNQEENEGGTTKTTAVVREERVVSDVIVKMIQKRGDETIPAKVKRAVIRQERTIRSGTAMHKLHETANPWQTIGIVVTLREKKVPLMQAIDLLDRIGTIGVTEILIVDEAPICPETDQQETEKEDRTATPSGTEIVHRMKTLTFAEKDLVMTIGIVSANSTTWNDPDTLGMKEAEIETETDPR